MSSDLPDGLLDSGGDQEGGGSVESDADEQSFERFTIVSIGDHRLAIPVTDVDTVINRHVETTRIPRAPEAVEGVTDIRGQITTIVDPHVHFPDSGGSSASPSLLVFADRDQPAATWVDDVDGVEAVPESGVVDQAEYEPTEIAGTALEHPLIVGAIRVERRRRGAIVESVAGDQPADDAARDGTDPLRDSTERAETEDGDVVVGEFSLDDDEPERTESPDETERSISEDVEVEVTPILDVDRFLLAAGRVAEERDPVTETTADRDAVGGGDGGFDPADGTSDAPGSSVSETNALEAHEVADDEADDEEPADDEAADDEADDEETDGDDDASGPDSFSDDRESAN